MKSLKQNMLKTCLLIAVFLTIGIANAQKDSVPKKQFDSLKRLGDSLKTRADSLKKLFDSGKIVVLRLDTAHKAPTDKCVQCRDEKPHSLEWLLILLPVVVFIILLLVLLTGIKDFSLKEALSENDYPKIVKENTAYAEACKAENLDKLKDIQNLEEVLPPTIEVSYLVDEKVPPAPKASISRYIAFITSILTLSIALCLSCFFVYHYIRSGCAPDISGMTTVLLALGMGVLPYAFNKVSTAISNNKAE